MFLGEALVDADVFTDEEPTLPFEEPAMHVILGDKRRHRLTVDAARRPSHGLHDFENARCACGKRITGYYAPVEESYAGALCEDGCFSSYEIELAADLRVAEEKRFRNGLAAHEEEHEESRRALAANRAAAKERMRIATDRMKRLEREPGKPDKPDEDK